MPVVHDQHQPERVGAGHVERADAEDPARSVGSSVGGRRTRRVRARGLDRQLVVAELLEGEAAEVLRRPGWRWPGGMAGAHAPGTTSRLAATRAAGRSRGADRYGDEQGDPERGERGAVEADAGHERGSTRPR